MKPSSRFYSPSRQLHKPPTGYFQTRHSSRHGPSSKKATPQGIPSHSAPISILLPTNTQAPRFISSSARQIRSSCYHDINLFFASLVHQHCFAAFASKSSSLARHSLPHPSSPSTAGVDLFILSVTTPPGYLAPTPVFQHQCPPILAVRPRSL